MQQAALPNVFADDISARAQQARFRGVGNPYSFLDSIGVIPIKEYIYRGANLIEIADTLNVSLTLLMNWIEQNDLGNEFADASKLSAEGYLYQAERLLKEAKDSFTLNKAKAMLEHARFMASKKDKSQYGTTQEAPGSGQGVTYIMNMYAGAPPQTTEMVSTKPAIDAEFAEVPPTVISLDFTSALDALEEVPQHIQEQAAHIRAAIVPVDEPSDTVRDVDRW